MIIPCSTVRLSVQLSLLLHPFHVSQESPWAAPSDQHSHAGEVSMSPRHSDYAANMVLVCGTMQKPESLTCYTGLSHLCGGPAAGCCLPDVMSCWLASRQEIMHRGIFNMCRSTWPQLLLRSGLSWIRKLDWLYFHERQCHHFCMLWRISGNPVKALDWSRPGFWKWQQESCSFHSPQLQLSQAAIPQQGPHPQVVHVSGWPLLGRV